MGYWEDMQGHPRHGSDFYLETKARSAVSEQDYRRMVLNLEFIATYYDEKDWFLKKNYRPQGKKDPWFSLAFFQKHLWQIRNDLAFCSMNMKNLPIKQIDSSQLDHSKPWPKIYQIILSYQLPLLSNPKLS